MHQFSLVQLDSQMECKALVPFDSCMYPLHSYFSESVLALSPVEGCPLIGPVVHITLH
jgi:hypothetical protein